LSERFVVKAGDHGSYLQKIC